MPRQDTLALWGKGVVKTKAGHLRYTSPKEKRGKYVHREVAERMLLDTPYSIRLLVPWPYEVHHMDYDKENNRPDNLILLDIRLHSSLTVDCRPRGYRGNRGRFAPRWKAKGNPQWELHFGEEIPF